MPSSTNRWVFRAVPGFFESHTEIAERCPGGRFITQTSLALLSRDYPSDSESSEHKTDWQRFAGHVRALNRDASPSVSYKILYLTRHGFGYHNQKHAEVGTEAWDSHWSLLNGDDTTTWFDSYLNETGIQQVKDLGRFWVNAARYDSVPIPQTLYTSPLARCLQTTDYVFSELVKANNRPFHPIVKEELRERFTVHTCDLRRPRSWIEKNFSGYRLEDNVTEEDQFSGQKRWETDHEHIARKQQALEDIFSSDTNEIISLTVHSFAIAAILEVCHGEKFKVREGTSLAMLVRGEFVSEQLPT
ncbi:hypothetical protein QQS21_007741 [Conoideocrella luteorostrata]|uniref:Phosphoglycerate mutase n=1 Tax=Conoideocrella luteorostrata TaxID=1105319 RepID=A0AAJ0FS36_9HYPO|nr:hypothetical protein QQS21_007741 [Conoideocrella luteorostrata]